MTRGGGGEGLAAYTGSSYWLLSLHLDPTDLDSVSSLSLLPVLGVVHPSLLSYTSRPVIPIAHSD